MKIQADLQYIVLHFQLLFIVYLYIVFTDEHQVNGACQTGLHSTYKNEKL